MGSLRLSRLFRKSLFVTILVGLLTAFGAAAYALDGSAYSVEVLVDGIPLREYTTSSAAYIEATKGREYAVRLTNHTPKRVAVALSVDGMNSIDAKTTTAREASKWILGPYASITIDGWQTSSSSARRFYFTTEARSYGAWLGKTRNLGLIAAAFFREQRPAHISRWHPSDGSPRLYGRDGERRDGPARPGAPPLADNRESGNVAGDAQAREAEGRVGALGVEAESGSGSDDAAGARDAGSTESQRSQRSRAQHERSHKEKTHADEFAATGIGRELDHRVERVVFNEEDTPSAILELRYEFRDALVHLGVLPRPRPRHENPYDRRESSRGFGNPHYSPDPYRGGWR